jgi:hypothetical protein
VKPKAGIFDVKAKMEKLKEGKKERKSEEPEEPARFGGHKPKEEKAEHVATGLQADGDYIVKFDPVTKLPLKKRGEPNDKRAERLKAEKEYGEQHPFWKKEQDAKKKAKGKRSKAAAKNK